MGNITIEPAQEEPCESCDDYVPEFSKDMTVYNSASVYPKNIILSTKTAWMRNHKMLIIELAPFRVIPAKNELIISSQIDLEISLSSISKSESSQSSIRPSSSFDKIVSTNTGSGYDAPLSYGPEKYLIIVPSSIASNSVLKDFVDWKIQKGYDVDLKTTTDIGGGYPATYTQIENYLDNLGTDYPSYLLLLGGGERETGVQAEYYDEHPDYVDMYPWAGYMDYPFACRGNEDLIPDLFVGRFPASNIAELELMLNKALQMDKIQNTDVYEKNLVTGQIQNYKDDINEVDRIFCETLDAVGSYFESRPSAENCIRAIVNPNNVTTDNVWNIGSLLWYGQNVFPKVVDCFVSQEEAVNRIIDAVDNTNVAIVQHRDHGMPEYWGKPRFFSSQVENLSNGNYLPLVLSMNCLTGQYNTIVPGGPNHPEGYKNFAKTWLNNQNGGAYAVVAAVGLSYSWYNDFLVHGIYTGLFSDYNTWINNSFTHKDINGNTLQPNDLFDPSETVSFTGLQQGAATKLGQMLNFGKMYVYSRYGDGNGTMVRTLNIYNLLGDPETDVVFKTPIDLSNKVSYPSQIEVGVTTNVTIEFSSIPTNNPLKVCIYSDELDIHEVVDYTPGDLNPTFSITPTEPGNIQVTITGFGIQPYMGDIIVENSGNVVYLSTGMTPVSATIGWGDIGYDESVNGNTLNINGTTYSKGIGTHAHSEIVYDIGGNNYKTFTSYVGVDNEVDGGSVKFKVYVDDILKGSSPTLTSNDNAYFFNIDVTGAQYLKLVAEDGGNGIARDHADWAEARVIK